MSVRIRRRIAGAARGFGRRVGGRLRVGRGFPVTVILLAVPFSAVSGQSALGAIAGVSRAGFTGSGAVEVVGRTTFMLGATADLPFGETFSLRPELYVATKGAAVNTTLGDYGRGPSKVFRLTYLQMPILAQLRTAPGGALRPHLFGGLSVGALLGCALQDDDCNEVAQLDRRRLDFGVVVGGEIEWRDLGVGARYEAGVRAMEVSTPGSEIYNGVLSFTLRYIFGR